MSRPADALAPLISLTSWLLLLAGALTVSLVAGSVDLVDADEARVRRQQEEAVAAALRADLAAWRSVETALRASDGFRREWARRELGGLVPQPIGVAVDDDLAVDPRRPDSTVPTVVHPAQWRPLAERLAHDDRLRAILLTASFVSMFVGITATTPSMFSLAASRRWLRQRYRIDPRHPLRGWIVPRPATDDTDKTSSEASPSIDSIRGIGASRDGA